CGIIYMLFGGAVGNLGSPEQVTKWLQVLQEQKDTGMFTITERGHGSNVRGIQTEATFDLDAQVRHLLFSVLFHGSRQQEYVQTILSFLSPASHPLPVLWPRSSGSEQHLSVLEEMDISSAFRSNSSQHLHNACHQLGSAPSTTHAFLGNPLTPVVLNPRSSISVPPIGPHCFIVPIRDEKESLYPGVPAIDMMHKEGLPGVDNGIVIFDKVRIPRENLLDKFGSVAPDGQYYSPIKSKSARFNTMLATLTPSRLAVTFQAVGTMKLGLTIAIRYSHSQRHFGPMGKEKVKIIEHQMQTLRLMPHLATVLALTFTSRYAASILGEDIFQGKELINSRSVKALVAGLKAYSTWENISCLQDCGECTGGMGYMMENRIAGLKCDTDVLVTFEDNNVVMLQ
ncbi:acyl-coenzyme A oxidase-like protein, partial [Nannospalax galili]|uniref:acyl-coenzyme A oxidase-like protein n=1 Tax=Nannospalax galili TaxID=1026970 RepID=UPI00111C0328